MGEKYIDVRDRQILEYLDHCQDCHTDYAVKLHLRHKCGPCRDKELLTPAFWKHWDAIWKHTEEMWKHTEALFDRLRRRLS